ncbi:MAG: hypothetical protein ACLQFR_17770, partial [Streptosporangiaceae bacterium]
ALVAAADLRAGLGRRDAAAAYTESLGPANDEADDREARAGRVGVLGRLARELLAYDQVDEALVRCEEAMDAASSPPDVAALADLDLLYRRLLLRAGRPVAAVVPPRLAPDYSPAAGLLIVEALLDQLDPTEALNRFLALPKASYPGAASPNARPGSPMAPALFELRGRIAAELMDFRTAIDSFEAARSGWVSLGSSPDADRVLALTIELHMRGLGDLVKAGSLLRPVHISAGVIPSETDLRLELLRAEHASRSDDIDTARQIVDHLLVQVTLEWPPHNRVLLALESLAVGGKSSQADTRALGDALGEVSPASARVALLPPLERLGSFESGRLPGAERFIELLPVPEDPSLSPREQALLSLRVVEALQVLGRPDDAIAWLDRAVTVLTGPGQTLFPLRALLLAGDWLGRHAESFKLGTDLLPRFREEFRDQRTLLMMALMEQRRRALAVGDGPAAQALFDEVSIHLKAQPPDSAHWFPQLHKTVPGADSVLGWTAPTRSLEVSLSDIPSSVSFDAPLLGQHPSSPMGSPAVPTLTDWTPREAGPLMPRPAAATVTATPSEIIKTPRGSPSLSLFETAVHGAPGDIPAWTGRLLVNTSFPQAAVWEIEGFAQGVAPFEAVDAFVRTWATLREDIAGMLQRPDGRDTGGGVTALRLEVDTRSLAPIPWEFLVQDPEGNGQPFRAGPFQVRHVHRGVHGMASPPASVRWLQDRLGRLVAPDLAVDGLDSTPRQGA